MQNIQQESQKSKYFKKNSNITNLKFVEPPDIFFQIKKNVFYIEEYYCKPCETYPSLLKITLNALLFFGAQLHSQCSLP